MKTPHGKRARPARLLSSSISIVPSCATRSSIELRPNLTLVSHDREWNQESSDSGSSHGRRGCSDFAVRGRRETTTLIDARASTLHSRETGHSSDCVDGYESTPSLSRRTPTTLGLRLEWSSYGSEPHVTTASWVPGPSMGSDTLRKRGPQEAYATQTNLHQQIQNLSMLSSSSNHGQRGKKRSQLKRTQGGQAPKSNLWLAQSSSTSTQLAHRGGVH